MTGVKPMMGVTTRVVTLMVITGFLMYAHTYIYNINTCVYPHIQYIHQCICTYIRTPIHIGSLARKPENRHTKELLTSKCYTPECI